MLRDQEKDTIDIIEYKLKQKCRSGGHKARMKDNRWTKRCTEWQPRGGKDQGDDQAEDGKTT